MIDLKTAPTGGPVLLSSEAEEPGYPSGLCLYLNAETLRKLGIGEGNLPQVGQEFAMRARVEVVSVSKSEGQIETGLQVELQVTHMQLGNEQQMAAQQVAGMYGA